MPEKQKKTYCVPVVALVEAYSKDEALDIVGEAACGNKVGVSVLLDEKLDPFAYDPDVYCVGSALDREEVEQEFEYSAIIEIDVCAVSPEKAARKTWELLRDPACVPWVVKIVKQGKELIDPPIEIDLWSAFEEE